MLKQILNPRSKKSVIIWLLLFSVVLVLITVPRFNRQDLWIIDDYTTGGNVASENLFDAGKYIEQTLYFRGERAVPTSAPWVFRPVVPFLAALLPLEPMTSVNVVNVFFLVTGLVGLWFTISLKTRAPFLKLVGSALYVFSFGPFYWGAIGYVDAASVGFLSLSTYLLVAKRWIPLAAAMAVGPFIKEPAVALFPALFGQLRFSMGRGWVFSSMITAAGGILMLGMLYLARLAAPDAGANYFWSVAWGNFVNWEIKDIIKFVFGLGVSFFLMIALVYPCRNMLKEVFSEIATFLGGGVATLFFVLFAVLCCQVAAGRFAWVTHPFLIPAVVIMLGMVIESRRKKALGVGSLT